MRIESPTVERADDVVDMWVDLAAEQRDHGSHILAGENRAAVRETVVSHAVTGGLLVALEEDAAGADDTLLGFVLFDRENGGYESDTDRGLIRYLYVRPDRRGEGIGSALLTAAEDRLFDSGVDAVALEVLADNEAARRFYRRHGYAPHRVELETKSDTHTKGG